MIEDLCGAIIAGGGSTRMGTDKSKLTLGNERVLDRVIHQLHQITDQVVLNKNEINDERIPIIEDIYEDSGPLGGLHAVMTHRSEEWFLLSACDTPFIDHRIILYLSEYRRNGRQAVIPVVNGRFQPLSGLYHKSALPVLKRCLNNGERRVVGLLDDIHTYYVDEFIGFPDTLIERHFFNMNTPEDYEIAQQLLKIP